MCKVSVIIPVYGTEKWIGACLDSVRAQTLADLEVICIDDHSPDRCGEILDGIAAEDPRVRVFHLSENRRQGYGRNLGFSHAKGEYVYFLDSDDKILPETLEELVRISDAERLDTVFFDAQDIFESEELKKIYMPQISRRAGTYPDHVLPGTDLLDLFIEQQEWTCYPQMIFWRASFLRENGIRYPEGAEHEDEYFAFAGLLLAKRARYIRKPYFIRRTRPDSVMTSPPAPKNFHGYLRNFCLMNRLTAEKGIRTKGTAVNIGRIYERARTLYEKLSDEYDLSKICSADPEDRYAFECFRSQMDGERYISQIDAGVLEQIRTFRKVWIYGAGVVGTRVFRRLTAYPDVEIAGFIVTERKNAPRVYRNRPLIELRDLQPEAGDGVIISVAEGLLPEIRKNLEERGIPWTYHRKIEDGNG